MRSEEHHRPNQQNISGERLAHMFLDKMREVPRKHEAVFTGTKVSVRSWSNATKTFRAWGDYWAWRQLGQAFIESGYHFDTDPGIADITVYLRGGKFLTTEPTWLPNRINPRTHNILWIYSHPDDITKEEINQYDEVFCLSESMINKCVEWGCPNVISEPLSSCSDMLPPEKCDIETHDVVFVGNARGESINPDGRDVIAALKDRPDLDVAIWGMKWDLPHLRWVVERGWWKGPYISYYKLNQVYNSAKIVLNDTHPDMAKWGFIPMKVLDIVRSGGFPLTDEIQGMEEVFGSSIATYKDTEDLSRKIDGFLSNASAREEMGIIARSLARDMTFRNCVEQLVRTSKFEWKVRASLSEKYLNDTN